MGEVLGEALEELKMLSAKGRGAVKLEYSEMWSGSKKMDSRQYTLWCSESRVELDWSVLIQPTKELLVLRWYSEPAPSSLEPAYFSFSYKTSSGLISSSSHSLQKASTSVIYPLPFSRLSVIQTKPDFPGPHSAAIVNNGPDFPIENSLSFALIGSITSKKRFWVSENSICVGA